jgi:3-hydroxyisobutyrate dehydrogenase
MIGYIGLGNMGGALARRLAVSNDIIGYDLNAEARRQFLETGAKVALDFAGLAQATQTIFLCLPTSQHVERALLGEDGLAQYLKPGSVLVDQTSGDPAITRRLAAALAKRNIVLVDAPVSGGPQGAAAGTIAIMVGGDQAVVDRLMPTLQTISPNIFHAGEVGSGHVIKLANNLLSAGQRLMTIEAVALAVKNGVSAELAVKIMGASGGNNFWLQKYGQSLLVNGELGSTFTLGLIHKDVRLACQMGVDSGMPMLFGSQAKEFYQMAINAFGADNAVNNIAYLVEKISNVDFIPKPATSR